MIRHVVFWTLKAEAEGKSKEANARMIKEKLCSLRDKIPGLTSINVYLNDNANDGNAADVMLESFHETWDALEKYQKHPMHVEVAKFIGKVRDNRMCLDCTLPG